MLAGCLLLLPIGCERRSDLPPLAPVTGRVTVGGEPLEFGTISFVPDAARGTIGPPGVSEIQPDGTFRISTAGEDGAVVGHHWVRLMAVEPSDGRTPGPPRSLVAARYNDPATAGLYREVRADAENDFEIEVEAE